MIISVITATYNAKKHLPRLLESLASQQCRDFELVVQDAASTDGTLDIIEAWRSHLPHVALASEKDNGIYDAWNKAIERAQGQWLLFLGADDALASDDVFTRAISVLREQPQHTLFAAGEGCLDFPDGTLHAFLKVDIANSAELFNYGSPVCHASLFYSMQLFNSHRFDTSFRVAADYDFLCQHWYNDQVIALNFLVTRMLVGGVSTTAASRWLTIRETLVISKKRRGFYPRPLCVLALKSLLHLSLHKILGSHWGDRVYDTLRQWNGHDAFWCKGKQ